MGRNNPGYEYALWCNASQKLFPLEMTIRERDLQYLGFKNSYHLGLKNVIKKGSVVRTSYLYYTKIIRGVGSINWYREPKYPVKKTTKLSNGGITSADRPHQRFTTRYYYY